ncbi:hypothetical protein [Pseudomonas gozinkensis]|uniref:hypothetical protein n=1 Tax=Pseudomonas gozinkensis TaxID=2774461 RepID=UPI00178889CF|nr:hypothetical protein [Pseudomonas gozinkensis]
MNFPNVDFENGDSVYIFTVDDFYYDGKFISFDQDAHALILDVKNEPQVIEMQNIVRMYGGIGGSVWLSEPQKTMKGCSTIETTALSNITLGQLLTFMDLNKQQVIARISNIDSNSTSITADILDASQRVNASGPINLASDRFILTADVTTSDDAKKVTWRPDSRSAAAGVGITMAINSHRENNPNWNYNRR